MNIQAIAAVAVTVVGVSKIARDITEHRRADLALRQREAQLSAIPTRLRRLRNSNIIGIYVATAAACRCSSGTRGWKSSLPRSSRFVLDLTARKRLEEELRR